MENTIEYLILFLTKVLDLYIVHRYINIFFKNCVVDKKIQVLSYIVRPLIAIVVEIYAPYAIINLLASIVTVLIIELCYEGKFSKKLIVAIVIYMCSFVAEIVVAMMIGFSGFSFFEEANNGSYFLLFIIQIFWWIFSLIIGKLKGAAVNMHIPRDFFVAVILTPIISIFLEVLIFQQEHIGRTIVLASLMCVILLNIVIIYLYDSLARTFEERTKMEIIKREKAYYHNQSELLQRNEEELRQFRHDVKNKILVIGQMLEKNEIESVSKYIEQIAGKLENSNTYSQSGNIVVDSIINYELNKAKKMGAEISANISIPSQLKVEEDDIIIILGNLLDNAIEAIGRIKENRYIIIDMEYDKNCLYLTIKNSYDSILKIENGTIKTRKKDSFLHGIGLKSVETTVEKYEGYLDIENNLNEFIVDAVLYV